MKRRAQAPSSRPARTCARRAGTWALRWLAAAALGGCAATNSGDSGEPDAGPVEPRCHMRIAITPDALRAPVGVEAAASVDSGGLTGVHSYAWTVSRDGAPVSATPLAGDAAIAFVADTPGIYEVILEGAIGDRPCLDAVERVNVADPAAGEPAYRLRLLPRSGQPIPIQEVPGSVLAGAGEDVALGTLALAPGVAVSGRVESDAGEPLAAYVRAVPRGAAVPWPVEGFSGADGALTLRLEDTRHDVLVVPLSSDGGHAPVLLTDLLAAPSWTLRVPAAPELPGTLVDREGEPLATAQIAVRTGDLPAVLATTDTAGAFAVPARAGAVGLTVVPPADTGLPWLELPAAEALDSSAGALDIAYDPGLESATFTATSPTPVPDARATWIARPMPDAGTIFAPGSAPDSGASSMTLTGTLRLPVRANAAGAWPEISLPRAVYDVILEPAGEGGASLIEVDLRAPGAPPALAPVAAATLAGTVVDADGAAVAGVEVVAAALGLLAQSPGAGASAVTDEDGRFSLGVTPGGSYELLLDDPARSHGRLRVIEDAPGPGQSRELGALALPRAFLAGGRLVLLPSGAAASGVVVQLVCAACAASEGHTPAAEAVTDAFGSFALRVPVPATAP